MSAGLFSNVGLWPSNSTDSSFPGYLQTEQDHFWQHVGCVVLLYYHHGSSGQTGHSVQSDQNYNFYTDYWFAFVGYHMMEEDYSDEVCYFYHIYHCMYCFVDIYQSWQTFYFQHYGKFSFVGLLPDQTGYQGSFGVCLIWGLIPTES